MKRYLGFCPLLLGLAFAPVSHAADSSALEKEIDVLKENTTELSTRLDDAMSVSGYTDAEYTSDSKKGGNADGFRIHHLSLFFEKRISDQWRFFSEIEYADGPKFEGKTAEGKIFAEAANLSYAWRPDLSFRLGRFFTPAGIWNVDHYPPFVPTQERPLHIRDIFPQIFDGAMVYGTRPIGGSFLKYDLCWGNGEGNAGRKDGNSEKATGLNVGLLLPFLKHTEIGLTYYGDTDNSRTEKLAGGAHAKIKAGGFALQSEYARGDYKPTSGSDYTNTGYYGQFMYNFRDWTIGMRHSVYDKNTATDAIDNKQVANGAFVNYHISHALVVKLEHHLFSYNNDTKDEYESTIFSVVAYLGN